MAMINQTSNVKSDNEETRGATQRSSSVGRAFTRMFSRSASENVNTNRSTSEGSVLGPEQTGSPQGSVQSVGRGRTPPRLTPLPAPSAETRETSPQPPNFLKITLLNSSEKSLRNYWGAQFHNYRNRHNKQRNITRRDSRAQPWQHQRLRIEVDIR